VFFLERTFMSLVPGPLAGAPSGPRAKKRKTQAKAWLKPGLNYLGPSGRKTALTVRGVKKLNKRAEFFRYRPLVGLRSKTSLTVRGVKKLDK
jgi:hypothetical protein